MIAPISRQAFSKTRAGRMIVTLRVLSFREGVVLSLS
jgi:hypothetical protein